MVVGVEGSAAVGAAGHPQSAWSIDFRLEPVPVDFCLFHSRLQSFILLMCFEAVHHVAAMMTSRAMNQSQMMTRKALPHQLMNESM